MSRSAIKQTSPSTLSQLVDGEPATVAGKSWRIEYRAWMVEDIRLVPKTYVILQARDERTGDLIPGRKPTRSGLRDQAFHWLQSLDDIEHHLQTVYWIRLFDAPHDTTNTYLAKVQDDIHRRTERKAEREYHEWKMQPYSLATEARRQNSKKTYHSRLVTH